MHKIGESWDPVLKCKIEYFESDSGLIYSHAHIDGVLEFTAVEPNKPIDKNGENENDDQKQDGD
jgi:hypothetical protein